MHKVQMVLLGVFFGGVLLGGIGAGVALVEYSSLDYGGERRFGEENLVTREMDYTFVPGEEQVTIVRGYWEAPVEADDTVPEGIIRYEVTYNEKMVEPSLYFWETGFQEKEGLDPVWDAEGGQEGRETAGEGQAGDGESTEGAGLDDGFGGQGKAGKQTCLEFHVNHVRSDMGLFMEYKDDVLAALKEKKIYQYDVVSISQLKIKVNPNTLPYVRGGEGLSASCRTSGQGA